MDVDRRLPQVRGGFRDQPGSMTFPLLFYREHALGLADLQIAATAQGHSYVARTRNLLT